MSDEREHIKECAVREARCLEALAELGVEVTIHRHPPVYTVEEAKALRGELEGAHIKNLFLCDRKKRRFWLLVARESTPINLKGLGKKLGCKLRFANADLLETHLGVEPGSVTPLAVINDVDGRVELLWDSGLLDCQLINAHPLHNAATMTVGAEALFKLFAATEHDPVVVDLESLLAV